MAYVYCGCAHLSPFLDIRQQILPLHSLLPPAISVCLSVCVCVCAVCVIPCHSHSQSHCHDITCCLLPAVLPLVCHSRVIAPLRPSFGTCASSHSGCQLSSLTLDALLDMIMQRLHRCWQCTVSVGK